MSIVLILRRTIEFQASPCQEKLAAALAVDGGTLPRSMRVHHITVILAASAGFGT
jgi:hypothetical protein